MVIQAQVIPQGWQCPGCKTIYAPTVTQCACQKQSLNTGARLEDYFRPGVAGVSIPNQGQNT